MKQSSDLSQKQKAFAKKIEQVPNNPWTFMSNFWFTKDEHDPTVRFKKYPAKGYQRVLIRAITTFNVLFIKKSRQIMLTHTMAGLMCWDSMYKYNRLEFVQSKKDEDAANVLDRSRFGYDWLKNNNFPILPSVKTTGDRTGTKRSIKFTDVDSTMRAIPMGPDILRMHTSSWIFSDEINHQQKGSESFGAAAPTIFGKGRFTAAGTSNGKNWVYRLMNSIDEKSGDTLGENTVDSRKVIKPMFQPDPEKSAEEQRYQIEDWLLSMTDEEFEAIPLEELVACCPGIDFWITAPPVGAEKGIACMWVHYSADPDKDPVTKVGKAWYREAKALMTQTQWEREMEGNDDTYEGRPVIPNWNRETFVKPCAYEPSEAIKIPVDFGTNVCCCAFVQFKIIEGSNRKQIRFLSEIKLEGSVANTPNLATKMGEKMRNQFPEAWQSGNYRCHPDPAGAQTRETTTEKSERTSIEILRANGFRCDVKKLSIHESTELVRNVFQTFYTLKSGEVIPAVVIDPSCEYMIGVFGGGWHYPDEDDGKGIPEKDGVWDHGGDCARHIFSAVFDAKDFGDSRLPQPKMKIIRDRYTGRVVRRIPVGRC